jgi:TP901 family phage tail tape measure protein
MAVRETLILEIKSDIAELKKGLAQSKQSVSGFQRQLQGVTGTLKVAFAAAMSAAAYQSINLARDFSKSMTQIKALVGVASDEVDQMGEAARRMATETGRSANQAAEALFFITSAGLRGADAMAVLEASLKASAVGLGETKTIADLATSALNAYGKENLSATDATDVLTASVREGKLEASALSAAMGQVLPVASNMGVQFHEVGAAFAAMSRTGTNAAEAATSLNAILAGLLKTTPDAEKALNELGLSSSGLKQQIKDDGLLSVLTTLKNKFDQNKDAVQRVFPNVRALKGVLDLVGASAETNAEIFVSLSKSVGATDEAFGKTKDASFEFDVQIAKLQDKLLSIGTKLLPIINKGLDLFNKLLDIGTQDYAADLENAKVKLYQLAKAEEDARLVVQKHIEARGEGSKDLKTYQANLDRATLATKNQLNVVTSLRQKIDDLTTSQNTAADSVNNLSGSTTGSTTPLEDYKNALIDVKENGIDKLVNEGLKPLETSLLKTIPQGLDLTKLKAREMEEEFEDTDLQGILDNFDNGIENLAIGAAVNFAQMALEGKKSFRQITHEIAKMIQKQILALVITTALKAAFAGKGFLEILPKLAAGLAVFAGAGIIAGATAPGEGGMEVPQMAAGGLVTKPTLAMIGERGAEAVIPLNRLDGMMGGNREFTIRGQDLVLAMDRANGFKSRITG